MPQNIDPNGPIWAAAIKLGYNDPANMSDAQYARVLLYVAGMLPAPPQSPFTQQTDDAAARAAADAADRAFALNLAHKVASAMTINSGAIAAADTARYNRAIANLTLIPAQPEPTADTVAYNKLEDLKRNLFLYLEAVTPGWTGNIDQPGHQSQAALLADLAGRYPDAAAAVNP